MFFGTTYDTFFAPECLIAEPRVWLASKLRKRADKRVGFLLFSPANEINVVYLYLGILCRLKR